MLADGELAIGLTFNPNEAANEIAAKALPATVVSYQHSAGTIGNTHFLAIPFNSRAKEGAQVAANFLLSPLAQARKADIRHWGDPTVLALEKLGSADRALFAAARRTRPGHATRAGAARTARVVGRPDRARMDTPLRAGRLSRLESAPRRPR